MDLQTICDGDVFCLPLRDFAAALQGNVYDYIILGAPLYSYEDPQAMLGLMRDHLSVGGRVTGRVEKDGEVFVLERHA